MDNLTLQGMDQREGREWGANTCGMDSLSQNLVVTNIITRLSYGNYFAFPVLEESQ